MTIYTEKTMSQGIGTFKGVILDCAQMGDLLPFYTAILGAPKFQDGDRWSVIQGQGGAVNLAAGAEATGNGIVLSVKVQDVEEAVAQATAAGGRIVIDIKKREHEIVAYVADPAGNVLALYQSA